MKIVNKTNNGSNINPSRIVMHHRPHQDELLALWLLRVGGKSVFPGIREMRVDFVRREVATCYPDTIYLGVGHGEFDEHRPEGRLQGTCTAMLVAQRIRALNHPRVGPLVQEALYCDTKSKGNQPFKVSQSMLESLVKAMHRIRKGGMQWETYVWAAKAFDALVYGDLDDSFNLCRAWKSYCSERALPEGDPAIERVSALVGNSARMRAKNLTELCSIVCRMDPRTRGAWLDETFGMLVDDARLYEAVFVEIEEKAQVFHVSTSSGKDIGAAIESDNEHVSHAMRSSKFGDAVVTIMRNSAGQTHIAVNPKREDLGMTWLAQMVRMAEYRTRTGKLLSERQADGPGTREAVPQWCMPFDGLLLNGSLTHPSIEASRLSVSDLMAIAASAFTGAGFEAWVESYRSSVESYAATA